MSQTLKKDGRTLFPGFSTTLSTIKSYTADIVEQSSGTYCLSRTTTHPTFSLSTLPTPSTCSSIDMRRVDAVQTVPQSIDNVLSYRSSVNVLPSTSKALGANTVIVQTVPQSTNGINTLSPRSRSIPQHTAGVSIVQSDSKPPASSRLTVPYTTSHIVKASIQRLTVHPETFTSTSIPATRSNLPSTNTSGFNTVYTQPTSSKNMPIIRVESCSNMNVAVIPQKVEQVESRKSTAKKPQEDNRLESNKKYKCSQCHMCYVRKVYLIRHVMGQHGSYNSCSKCMQLFPTEAEYNQHMLRFHSSFNCELCGAAFPNKYGLRKHVDTHRDTKDHLLKCPFKNCSYSHSRFTYFEYHINKHRKKNPFRCGKCNKQFCSRYMFNRHVRTCIGDFGECPKCERKYTNDSMLYDHIQACHVDKIYACPECERTYKWRASLSRHLTMDH